MKNHWVKVWDIPWTWKAIELEAYDEGGSSTEKIDTWDVSVRRKQEMDHAGIDVEMRGTGRTYAFRFYDQRHWNHEENRFKIYD